MATAARKSSKTEPKRDARQLAVDAAKLAAETRCNNVVVLHVAEQSPVTDYFVLCTGTSARQMRAVADQIEELAAGQGERVINRSIDDHWVLLDFVDVVVHLFSDEARAFYDLDSLWGDAERVTWR